MKSNILLISFVIDYIEEHLNEKIDLNILSIKTGYSKYHLHRMFSQIAGISLHSYINKRQLTEAAFKLVKSDFSIIQISLDCGYQTQQSFSQVFKKYYKMSPLKFRRKKYYYPLQTKLELNGNLVSINEYKIDSIEIIKKEAIKLVGYKSSMLKGFFVIPRLWNKLHKIKNKIPNRSDDEYIVGINDYSKMKECTTNNKAFDYYAAVEVDGKVDCNLLGMDSFLIPETRYVCFVYYGNSRESMEPVISYIYKTWFLKSNLQLNDEIRLDYIRYGESQNSDGNNRIELFIPII